MGVTVSSSHIVSAAPSSSGAGLLTLCSCSSTTWDTVLHELFTSSSQIAPAWVASTGCSPSGTGCSSVGPPRGHKPCQQTCSSVGSSLHGSTGPGRSLLQHGLPTGSQSPSGIHLLRCGVLHRLQMEICSTVDLHGPQGHSLPHHGLLHGLQGKISALVSGAFPPPPCSLTLVSVELFLSHSLTPLCCCSCCCAGFSPFLHTLSQRRYRCR